MLLYENLVTSNKEAFTAKVIQISQELGIDPNWLMYVMKKESGLNPAAVNSVNGASGLIQFINSTAQGLGTSLTAIRQMSNVQQLDLVRKYYWPYRSKIKSAVDLYLATFYPVAIGKPGSYALGSTPSSMVLIASQNAALDYNKDKKITVDEVTKWFLSGAPQSIVDALQKKNQPSNENRSNSGSVCPCCGRPLPVS